MSAAVALGRLARVEPREVWPNEAANFTPWLAEEGSIAVLGEALGIELEVEAVERAVGPFRADILCKDVVEDAWVLIENQLEASDHRHLGQILTYASGLKAFTIVWIATRFTEEHRATLDWLNEITGREVRFFALEVELWRIGASPPAPKFNVVCRPNDWSRSVKRGAAEVEDANLDGNQAANLALWTALDAALRDRGGSVAATSRPGRAEWRNYKVGRTNFGLSAIIARRQDLIRAELGIGGELAKVHFDALLENREGFDRAFGASLDWQRLENRQGCRIAVNRPGTDLSGDARIAAAAGWLADNLIRLHATFAEAVLALPQTPDA